VTLLIVQFKVSTHKYIGEMIGEIILLLIVVVIILAIIASRPRSILKEEITENLNVRTTVHKKSSRVRFSPDKKERTYNVKTGQIVGEDIIVPVEESESER
jgi:hypothetical protein